MKIWLILGGLSAEREVSLESGEAVARALLDRGHTVWAYDLREGLFLEHLSSELPAVQVETPPGGWRAGAPAGPRTAASPVGVQAMEAADARFSVHWAPRLMEIALRLRDQMDVAFLALHGGEGEGGAVQTMLELAGVPFTGSGPLTSALCLHKVLLKRVMESLGIPTPPWTVLPVAPRGPIPPPGDAGFDPPLVVKPVEGGSSIGVTIVREPEQWEEALRLAAQAARPRAPAVPVLVEDYIDGKELTVGILGNEALPVVEIVPRTGFYDYDRKYVPGETTYQVPAVIDAAGARELQRQALALFTAAGCRGVARVDFRFSPEGQGYCLELNTIPGLTSTSLLPKAAQAVGRSFGELLELICAEGMAAAR